MDRSSTSGGRASSSAYLLRALVDFAARRGADIGVIAKAVDYELALLHDEHTRVPVTVFSGLWNEVASALNDPLLGLHFGESFAKQSGGHFLFTIMRNCETLEAAIRSLIRYHNLMSDMVRPSLSIRSGKASLGPDDNSRGAGTTRHQADAVLSLLATVLRAITDKGIVFEKILLAHPALDDDGEYARVFGKKPVFNADSNRIVFDASELRRAFPLAHREFGARLHDYAEKLEGRLHQSGSYNERLLSMLQERILRGEDCSLAIAASSFHMSVRHLQNKLREEGFSYQALLDEARKGIALRHMRKGEVMFCDIAFLLGFSEQSSFTHAFRKWTGLTPREYREEIIGSSGAAPSDKSTHKKRS